MRTKTIKFWSGYTSVQEWKETFTHKMELPDGRIIRGNPASKFWMLQVGRNQMSFYGPAPKEWDDSLAVADFFEEISEVECDFS